MSPRRLLPAVVAAAATLSACGHRIRPEVLRQAALTELAQADARVLDGCLACVTGARDTYVRLSTGPARPIAVTRRFEVDLLILLRDRELAIDTTAAMTELHAAAAALPPGLDTTRMIALGDLVPPNASGVSDLAGSAFDRAHPNTVVGLAGELQWLSTTTLWQPVREYLTLSVECSDLGRPFRPPPPGAGVPGDDSPLLVYRRALCAGSAGLDRLTQLHDASPAFAEAAYYLARSAPATRLQRSMMRNLVAAAYAAFPQSPAATYLSGMSAQLVSDCGSALRFYDETLALQDHHENAQLGRAACLTYLRRPDEAIEAATRLIGWQSSNLRDAYYWRAFNYHVQHRLDLARADSDASKRHGSTVDNETLAGIVEYEQNDVEVATTDLDRAWDMSRGRACSAAWYQALVQIKRDDWAGAGRGFEHAMDCYGTNVREDQTGLAAMEARDDLDADFKAAQIRNFQIAVGEDQRQQRTSALNAATAAANVADIGKAETLLAFADAEPSLAEPIAALRKFIADHYPAVAPAQ